MGFQSGINGTVHFFFIAVVLQMPDYASFYLVALFATGLLSAPLFVKLSYRLGKHRTLRRHAHFQYRHLCVIFPTCGWILADIRRLPVYRLEFRRARPPDAIHHVGCY